MVGRFQRGDKTAFDDLVRKHGQRVSRFACHLTKNGDEAADIVANTFYRAFRSLEGFKGDSSFICWLYRIELNCFLDLRKKTHSRSTVSLDEPPFRRGGQAALQLVDRGESAQEHVERSERIHEIEGAIGCLSLNQRRILMMYQAEAMSYEDIALVMGIPLGTVKSRLNRARIRIRQIIRIRRNRIVK